jgi:hypothetical protein
MIPSERTKLKPDLIGHLEGTEMYSFRNSALILAVLLPGSACSVPGTATPTKSPAEIACLAAVAEVVNGPDVTTISVSPAEAVTNVMVNVDGALAPWLCVADTDGNVQEVMFTQQG